MPSPWIERTFSFEHLEADDFPSLVDRLRATPAELEDAVKDLPRDLLTRREAEAWSIQEHVGHLVEVDALHTGRLDDYREGASTLRPADMKNRRTEAARYNQREMGDVLASFRSVRGRFVARLDAWEPEGRLTTAFHPRLQQPVRVVDMVHFAVEHDAHHLARVKELARGR
jgi:uncharacterized damage-inducible protein DinB